MKNKKIIRKIKNLILQYSNIFENLENIKQENKSQNKKPMKNRIKIYC
jgi:hypothetical protein